LTVLNPTCSDVGATSCSTEKFERGIFQIKLQVVVVVVVIIIIIIIIIIVIKKSDPRHTEF